MFNIYECKRRTKGQKNRFYYLLKEDYKYIKREPLYYLMSRFNNIIIGDLNNCDILICAHYDIFYDCYISRLMNFENKNKTFLKYSVNQALFLIVFIIFALIIKEIIPKWMIIILFIILIFPLKNIKASGYNDNSSGIDIALRFVNKKNVAIALFDLEELGRWGSKGFTKRNSDILNDKLIINLDTVGKGDIVCLSPSEKAFEYVKELKRQYDYDYEIFETPLPGDHVSFMKLKCIGITRADRDSKNRLYALNIHSRKDNEDNIDAEKLNEIEELVKVIIKDWVGE
ncbi:M28 family metallopeptidase [[Clostridium] innocuum]|nr:M28 family metallopeptidase [[Clostridium] innocuum]